MSAQLRTTRWKWRSEHMAIRIPPNIQITEGLKIHVGNECRFTVTGVTTQNGETRYELTDDTGTSLVATRDEDGTMREAEN